MKALLFISLLLTGIARGGLTWEQTEYRFKPHPALAGTETVFRFTNTGEKAVTISGIKSTCGCLTASLIKKVYQPGESGELKVRFDLRSRTGKQRKAIIVTTAAKHQTLLYMTADIPQAYTLKPTGALPRTEEIKRVTLINTNKVPNILTLLPSSNPQMTAELKIIKAGFEYEVIIPPTATPTGRSVLLLKTAPPPGEKESRTLRLYITKKRFTLRG